MVGPAVGTHRISSHGWHGLGSAATAAAVLTATAATAGA